MAKKMIWLLAGAMMITTSAVAQTPGQKDDWTQYLHFQAAPRQGDTLHYETMPWRSMDRDQDGNVSRDEIRAPMKAKAMAAPHPLFAKLDQNKDGMIGHDEMMAAPMPHDGSTGEAAIERHEKRVNAFFDRYDRNQDGMVDQVEYVDHMAIREKTRQKMIMPAAGGEAHQQIKTMNREWGQAEKDPTMMSGKDNGAVAAPSVAVERDALRAKHHEEVRELLTEEKVN